MTVKTIDEQWEENILSSIRDISDLQAQALAWSGQHPTLASSFTEEISMLYDQFDFPQYLRTYVSEKGRNAYYDQLVLLDQAVKQFEDMGYQMEDEPDGFKKILNDSRWKKITAIALEIINSSKQSAIWAGKKE